MRQWTFLLGPGLIPRINALFLGYVMYRSRLVPRLIPAIGLVGAPLILASATGTIVGAGDHSTIRAAGALPIAVWEFSLGVHRNHQGLPARGRHRRLRTHDRGSAAPPTGSRSCFPGAAHDTVVGRRSVWKSPAGRRGRRRRRDVWLRGGSRLRQIDVPTPTGGCVRSMAGVGRLGG